MGIIGIGTGRMESIEAAGPLVAVAIPIIREIVKLTPTRSDDEILALLDYFKVERLFSAGEDRSVVLRDIAAQVVQSRVKDPVTNRVLNLAVELAYGAVRNGA